MALDVTDADQVRDVMAAVDAETPLGTVVCNAGVAFAAPLVEVEIAAYDRLMAVNVRGVFLVLQAALRAMLPRGAGSVVTLCSTSSFTASTGPMAVYDASKGAVKLMTQAAAREVAGTGVRVNGVAPGHARDRPHPGPRDLRAAGRPGSRADPAGPARQAVGDRRGGGLPVLRRRLVHHGGGARGGRRLARLAPCDSS